MLSASIVLIGRANVGKSTLFNRLTKTRDAIVGEIAGVTRDRHFGVACFEKKRFTIVDTGGWEKTESRSIGSDVEQQTIQAIKDATIILLILDAREGLQTRDFEIASRIRKLGVACRVVINKAEGTNLDAVGGEFSQLGFTEPFFISALHGDGIYELMSELSACVEFTTEARLNKKGTRIAIVGKPNVGKSTLINKLIGEERIITRDEPGTTRDSITVEFEYKGRALQLVDTAGIRKKARVSDKIEKFSILKTFESIDESDVVVLLIDGVAGLTEQDSKLGGYVAEAGKALVIAVNKSDRITNSKRERIKFQIDDKLKFLSFSSKIFLSALAGSGLHHLLLSVERAHKAATTRLGSSTLNKALIAALQKQSPPMIGRHRPKLKFAHQGGVSPPRIVIHGTSAHKLPESYQRFLKNHFMNTFKLRGTPLKLIFRSSVNPFRHSR